jgi:protocatechuate 3,4-dioxygenase beta subunit
MVQASWIVALLATGLVASAHPGQSEHSKRAEAHARRAYLASLENTDLAHCAPKLAARGIVERTIQRRKETLVALRKRNGLEDADISEPQVQKRQDYIFKDVLAKDHKSKLNLAATWKSADWTLLGQNQSVVLHPEATEGPYYVAGESIRKDVTDGQKGLVVHLDLQVIDIKTCLPVTNSALEIWSANATGVYGGVNGGFGNGNGVTDPNLVQSKALRGIQISNKDGAVQFQTLFPGHYVGRTNHIHVLTHSNQTVLQNSTIAGGTINHVGQIFFDQSLIDEVAKTGPYASNTAPRFMNKNDNIMAAGTAGKADNVAEYVLIGSKLNDGIFAWLNFGIDTSLIRNVRAAAECTATGCASKPFDVAGILQELMGKGKGGKGAGPVGMPKMPPGGIPGYEAPSLSIMMGGKGGAGSFGDLFGMMFGGAKGSKGAPPAGKGKAAKSTTAPTKLST